MDNLSNHHHGHPPKVVWLRCGNSTVARVEQLLRAHAGRMIAFEADPDSACLEIWPSTDPANARTRREFGLPPNQPYRS